MTQDFLWGTASSAYQSEGAWQADGKSLSNWDVYTNTHRVVERLTGRQETGNVAINAYDRAQSRADIALMRRLGLTAHRFSLSWARLIPDGVGAVNPAAVAHYRTFVADLRAAGIAPVATLYHWDHPAQLDARGGWHNPESVAWFRAYARAAIAALGDLVETFVTMNEPFIDLFLVEPMVQNLIAGRPARATSAQYATQIVAAHHWMLAHAGTLRDAREAGCRARLGIALPLSLTTPSDPSSARDVAAAALQDGLRNRWFLDALFRGDYPDDILAAYRAHGSPLRVTPQDRALLRDAKPDFLGVNFYAQAHVTADTEGAFGIGFANPDKVPACNGPVRPLALHDLLLRVHTDYGAPTMTITENGAGFVGHDDMPVDGRVADDLRSEYIAGHVDAVLSARRVGARVNGYFLWSLCDNFEWIWGTGPRFGLVHVDMATQRRTPKDSFATYAALIARGADGSGASYLTGDGLS
jgi:beta-glucosidase